MTTCEEIEDQVCEGVFNAKELKELLEDFFCPRRKFVLAAPFFKRASSPFVKIGTLGTYDAIGPFSVPFCSWRAPESSDGAWLIRVVPERSINCDRRSRFSKTVIKLSKCLVRHVQ